MDMIYGFLHESYYDGWKYGSTVEKNGFALKVVVLLVLWLDVFLAAMKDINRIFGIVMLEIVIVWVERKVKKDIHICIFIHTYIHVGCFLI